MNEQRLSSDDPRITAYALGEMSGEDRVVFEEQLKGDAAARALIEEIRTLSARLESALADEESEVGEEAEALAGDRGARGRGFLNTEDDPYRRKPLRFPYVLVGSLAAACFAVVVAWRGDRPSSEAGAATGIEVAEAEAAATARLTETSSAAGGDAGPSIFLVRDAEEFAALPVAAVAPMRPELTEPLEKAETPSATADSVYSRNHDAGARYHFLANGDFSPVRNTPHSSFGIDVETMSYARVRRALAEGRRPPREAVRVEEMVNYFNYVYAAPSEQVREPFAASMEIAAAPWNPAHRLVRIGVKGREFAVKQRAPANLVFLVDVSGSMGAENKLPLVKESVRRLVETLRREDKVSIVTYAGGPGLALESTGADDKRAILAALEGLSTGGAGNRAAGIQLAYEIAKANFSPGGANRVILCTDGDFEVGANSNGELTELIEQRAQSGVALTVLGFGMEGRKDGRIEELAEKGKGNYGYIDSRAEAQKILMAQAGGSVATIAEDVELKVEFNPAMAQAYRLLGYEERAAAARPEFIPMGDAEDGEIGAGHTVTALYEIVPVAAASASEPGPAGEQSTRPSTDVEGTVADARTFLEAGENAELLTLRIEFREPRVDVRRQIEIPAIDTGAAFEAASKDFKFAAAVASLGMILRESAHAGAADYDRVISWAESGKGEDADGRRGEFIELVKKARALSAE